MQKNYPKKELVLNIIRLYSKFCLNDNNVRSKLSMLHDSKFAREFRGKTKLSN